MELTHKKKTEIPSSSQTILTSVVLTLCLVSDSLLYLLLPLYFNDFGIAFIWVGILLSVNRLVRILLQSWLTHWYQLLGLRNTMLVSVLFAAIGCTVFTIDLPIYWLLIGRFFWGIAYALMRMCCLFSATEDPKTSASNLGWYTALQEVGPLGVLMLAPFLIQQLHPQTIMTFPLVLCLIAIIPVLMLQSNTTTVRCNKTNRSLSYTLRFSYKAKNRLRLLVPTWNKDNALTLIFSTLYEGVWIVTLASLFVGNGSSQLQALNYVAMLLVIRRGFNFVLGLSVVNSKKSIFNRSSLGVSSLLMLLATFMIFFDYLILGSLIAIVGRGFYMILMPKVLSDESSCQVDKQNAINTFSLWRDIASALGAFLGGILLHFGLVKLFFLCFALIVTLILIKHQWGHFRLKVNIK